MAPTLPHGMDSMASGQARAHVASKAELLSRT